MQLHELKTNHKEKRSQRIGRGGKRGTTSGRGQKGQKSRSGHRIRPAERDLILRLPKRRGFRNKPRISKPLILNLDDILAKLKTHSGEHLVDVGFLKESGLIPSDYRGAVKILGNGSPKIPLSLKGLKVSEGAKIKIEKAGGKISF